MIEQLGGHLESSQGQSNMCLFSTGFSPVRKICSDVFSTGSSSFGNVHLLWHGSSNGCSEYLLLHSSSTGCREYLLHCGTPPPPPPPFSDLGDPSVVSHSFCSLLLSLPGVFLPFLKCVFAEASPTLFIVSALSCSGSIAELAETSRVRHRAALYLFPQRPPLQRPHTHTHYQALPHIPNACTNCYHGNPYCLGRRVEFIMHVYQGVSKRQGVERIGNNWKGIRGKGCKG